MPVPATDDGEEEYLKTSFRWRAWVPRSYFWCCIASYCCTTLPAERHFRICLGHQPSRFHWCACDPVDCYRGGAILDRSRSSPTALTLKLFAPHAPSTNRHAYGPELPTRSVWSETFRSHRRPSSSSGWVKNSGRSSCRNIWKYWAPVRR